MKSMVAIECFTRDGSNLPKILHRRFRPTLALLSQIGGIFEDTSIAKTHTTNGSVSGRVSKILDDVTLNGSVSLAEINTGLVLHTKTDGDILYIFPSLGIKQSHVEAEGQGFRRPRFGVAPTMGQNATVNVLLRMGRTNGTVEISTADGAQSDTQESTSVTRSKKQVSNLPLEWPQSLLFGDVVDRHRPPKATSEQTLERSTVP